MSVAFVIYNNLLEKETKMTVCRIKGTKYYGLRDKLLKMVIAVGTKSEMEELKRRIEE